MIKNCYEFMRLNNTNIPKKWLSKSIIGDLEKFLQINWNNRSVFYSDSNSSSKQQFLTFSNKNCLSTKNYIGTIAYKGDQLNIFPKVFKLNKNDYSTDHLDSKELLNNIVFWLKYCNKSTFPFLQFSANLDDSDNLKDLFISLYVRYVKIIIDKKIFFEYIDEIEDSSNIKGKFNYKDYIFKKKPRGIYTKFECKYSKYEYNNKTNQIIKFTCKQLYNISNKSNKMMIRYILQKLEPVSLTPCTPKDCEILKFNIWNKDYEIIINMSKIFLLNKVSNFDFDYTQSFCFLFPAELLFEGFIGGVTKKVIEELNGTVKLQKSDKYLLDEIQFKNQLYRETFLMKHDIFIEINEKIYILDTKYKETLQFNTDPRKSILESIKQTDIYQICEYARIRKVEEVFLIYPKYKTDNKELLFPKGISGNIKINFIRIPFIIEQDQDKTINDIKEIIYNWGVYTR